MMNNLGFLFSFKKGEINLAKIDSILREKQPKEYCQLNAKKRNKRRKPNEEHLSFRDIDRMMRHNMGIDESKCRGR